MIYFIIMTQTVELLKLLPLRVGDSSLLPLKIKKLVLKRQKGIATKNSNSPIVFVWTRSEGIDFEWEQRTVTHPEWK